jgi:hypothetical protein
MVRASDLRGFAAEAVLSREMKKCSCRARHYPAFFAIWFRCSGSASRANASQSLAAFSRADFLAGSVVLAARFLASVARRR